MQNYFVLKPTGEGNIRGRSCVVAVFGTTRNMRVVGNIPYLVHGMCVKFDLTSDNHVKDYQLDMTPNNVAALERAGINPEEYEIVLTRHKKLKSEGVGWNVAKLSLDKIYEVLPFGQADRIHKEMVNNMAEETRMNAIQEEIIQNARMRKQIAYNMNEYLSYFNGVERKGAYAHLAMVTKRMCVERENFQYSSGIIWDKKMQIKEQYILNNIMTRIDNEYDLLTEAQIELFVKSRSFKQRGLSDEQAEVLKCLLTSRPCVVTGGAGTGKTTVVKALIDCYAKTYNKGQILLAAPTGKAARRLAEKTNLSASTIHKALRKNPEDDYVYYNEERPLPHTLVIIDESSMIDSELMYDLLAAVDPTSKIVFVGDHNQLEPVGYGEPFFDFQKPQSDGRSLLEVYKLTQNHRQAEGTAIADAAQDALDGKPLIEGNGVNIKMIDFYDIPRIVKCADADTQVLSPYNELNSGINEYMKRGEDALNVGDKVIMIANSKQYSNGDIGYIERFDDKGAVYILIEGKTIKVTEAHQKDIRLAYSITIHKMQGSEQDKVILFIPKNDTFVSNRMLYTAITRAKKEITIYYYEIEGRKKK